MDYTEIETIAGNVARALGSPWYFAPNEEPYPTQHIKSDTVASLHLHLVTYGADKGRVSISGSLNIGKNGQYFTTYENHQRANVPSITVAASRGAEAIAKEIKRRLLPEYTRILALAIQQRDSAQQYADTTRANLAKLAAIVNARVPEDENASHTSFYRNDGAYGSIQTSPSTVQLELRSLTIDQAQHILQYIARKA